MKKKKLPHQKKPLLNGIRTGTTAAFPTLSSAKPAAVAAPAAATSPVPAATSAASLSFPSLKNSFSHPSFSQAGVAGVRAAAPLLSPVQQPQTLAVSNVASAPAPAFSGGAGMVAPRSAASSASTPAGGAAGKEKLLVQALLGFFLTSGGNDTFSNNSIPQTQVAAHVPSPREIAAKTQDEIQNLLLRQLIHQRQEQVEQLEENVRAHRHVLEAIAKLNHKPTAATANPGVAAPAPAVAPAVAAPAVHSTRPANVSISDWVRSKLNAPDTTSGSCCITKPSATITKDIHHHQGGSSGGMNKEMQELLPTCSHGKE